MYGGQSATEDRSNGLGNSGDGSEASFVSAQLETVLNVHQLRIDEFRRSAAINVS